MAQGKIVRIRVNPTDCLSCIDVAVKVGLLPPGVSFSTVVSTALRTLLETARASDIIPVRSGSEYYDIMSRFTDDPKHDRGRKLALNAALNPPSSEIVYPVAKPGPMPVASTQRNRLETRASELRFQRSQDPDNFSPEQQAELEAIADQLAGLS